MQPLLTDQRRGDRAYFDGHGEPVDECALISQIHLGLDPGDPACTCGQDQQQRANVRRAGLLERGTTRPAGQRQREQQRQVRTWRGDPNTGCRAHSTTCSPPCCPWSRRPCPATASTTGPPAATPPRVPRKRPGLHAQRGGERRQPAAAASWFRQAACHPACSARLSPSPRPPPGPLRRHNSRGGSSLHSRDGRDQKGRVIRGGT